MISATVLITIVSALTLGITAGYLSIIGILRFMGSRATPVLATHPAQRSLASTSSSGD
jgi:hypothetical protein